MSRPDETFFCSRFTGFSRRVSQPDAGSCHRYRRLRLVQFLFMFFFPPVFRSNTFLIRRKMMLWLYGCQRIGSERTILVSYRAVDLNVTRMWRLSFFDHVSTSVCGRRFFSMPVDAISRLHPAGGMRPEHARLLFAHPSRNKCGLIVAPPASGR